MESRESLVWWLWHKQVYKELCGQASGHEVWGPLYCEDVPAHGHGGNNNNHMKNRQLSVHLCHWASGADTMGSWVEQSELQREAPMDIGVQVSTFLGY